MPDRWGAAKEGSSPVREQLDIPDERREDMSATDEAKENAGLAIESAVSFLTLCCITQ